MKVSIYIEDGVTQLVLTPETDWEKNVLRSMENGERTVEIHRGSFYLCQGGYYRYDASALDESLMLVSKLKAQSGVAT